MTRVAISALAALLLPCTAPAQTWTGATAGNWNNPGDWSPAAVPTSSRDTQLSFGATANAAMTDDIPGLFTMNQMTFAAGSPAYSLNGIGLTFQSSSAGSGPQIMDNSANGVTLSLPLTLTNSLTVNGTGPLTVTNPIGGAGGLTVAGGGTLTLTSTSGSYSGGTNVVNGVLSVASDAALGTGNVTGTSSGTLAFTAGTSTTKSFAMNGGGLTVAAGQLVTLNGSTVSGAFLDGAGTFNTYITTGNRFVNVTASPAVSVTSNNANDQFVHFTNGGKFTVAAGLNTTGTGTTVNFDGFTNQGSGSITVGAASQVNVSNFQSYGTLTLNPGRRPAAGDRRFDRTSARRRWTSTAAAGRSSARRRRPARTLARVDLHGQNAIVAGGLFVNNGFVGDSTGTGATIIADFGSLVKGPDVLPNSRDHPERRQVPGRQQPDRRRSARSCFGPGGVDNYVFAIDGQKTLLKNVGTAPLGFNGGSRTVIGTPATAGQQLAGIDLNGRTPSSWTGCSSTTASSLTRPTTGPEREGYYPLRFVGRRATICRTRRRPFPAAGSRPASAPRRSGRWCSARAACRTTSSPSTTPRARRAEARWPTAGPAAGDSWRRPAVRWPG